MSDATPPPIDPAMLRYLRRLVTVLSVTMIGGFLVIVALFVLRFGAAPSVTLPPEITLPDGTRPIAVTWGPDWYAVATESEILVFGADGRLRRRVPVSE